jgi:hypothetical protein
MTHLEKPRVEYLLAAGLPFDSAKKVAQANVLNIFSISLPGIQNSEDLDIANSGDGNAALLAISAILQGFRTESELSVLLSTIANDISTDGILNNTVVASSLIDHALLLDTTTIRNNISNYYLNLNITPSIPHFEYYIHQFISNTTFSVTNSVIVFPTAGAFGDNLLVKTQLNYSGSNFSCAVSMKHCSQFKVKITTLSGPPWGYFLGTEVNWNINGDHLTVIDDDMPADVKMAFNPGTYLLEYFEINSTDVTFSKTITVN